LIRVRFSRLSHLRRRRRASVVESRERVSEQFHLSKNK
jgi:hypothetical protein